MAAGIGERAADRAWSLVGASFCLGGRDAAVGLDCIGLVLVSYRLDPPPSHPARLSLLATANAPWERCLAEVGFARVESEGAQAGDVHFLDCGRGRRHLALWTAEGFVHADAVLRKVVAVPTLTDMRCLARYRHDRARHGVLFCI